MRFWDSSAIVPLLVQQSGSGRAAAWFGDDPEPAIWTLTMVELTSALWRLVREQALAEAVATAAERRGQEFAAASHMVADVEGVTSLARRALRVHALRAADAMQLGAALLWSAGRPQDCTLLTLDDRLALAARREGFVVPA